MESLTWFESRRVPPGPGEVELALRALPLNFKDVIKALGYVD